MLKNIYEKSKHIIVSLRFMILSIFITLFLSTMFVIIFLRSIAYLDAVTYASKYLMDAGTTRVLHVITRNLRPAQIDTELSAHLLQNNVIKRSASELIPYTYYLVKTQNLVTEAYWGDEQGNFIAAVKRPDGTISTVIYNRNVSPAVHEVILRDKQGNIIGHQFSKDLSFDPRKRPWYIKAKAKKTSIWTDIYLFEPYPALGISAATPVFLNHQFIGAFGMDVSLDYLSDFISDLQLGKTGYAFVVNEKENLVAFPKRPPFNHLAAQPFQLFNIHTAKLPLIDAALDRYKKTRQEIQLVKFNGQEYLISFLPVSDMEEQGWLIGAVSPQNDFIGALKQLNYTTLEITLLILILGIYLVSNLISRIVRPINVLAKETIKIKNFELDDEITIRSRIKEVLMLTEAVKAMKSGLKHFQKYVPKMLVHQLIASGEDARVGGVKKQLVVLFSDIQNFTSIAEKMDPNQLMLQVCEYFEALSQIIISENGTIDKYIGDSIMAFWGAPLPELDPCGHAARAALKCEEKLLELNIKWQNEGRYPLYTRVGIHMGDAIVGNLGSSERLNYTAIGDTINISSRLEAINKKYKTHIIVSEAVYHCIKDKFVLRLIDYVKVKGKRKRLYIYELLGDNADALSFNIYDYREQFEHGFEAYENEEWDVAIVFFKKCLVIYPEDTIAPIFIERCQKLKEEQNRP